MSDSVDLRSVLTKVTTGKKYAADVDRIKSLDDEQQLLEFRSLFRFRVFSPQVDFRIQKPDEPYSKEFFEALMNGVKEWYDEVSAEKWTFEIPSYEELVKEVDEMDYATSVETCPWFMTSRSEPVVRV